MIRLALALIALLAGPVLAEDAPVFVSYGTSSGSLPPEFAWDNEVTILADGKLLIRHCKGYATEGPGCRTRKGKVTEAAMETIRAAAQASDLATNPAKKAQDPLVGGGGSWGTVYIDGQEYKLPWEPAVQDANRVGAVKAAIEAAIPDRFNRFMYAD